MRVTGFDKAKVSADPSDCEMILPPRRNTVERGAARTYSAKSSAEGGKARHILETLKLPSRTEALASRWWKALLFNDEHSANGVMTWPWRSAPRWRSTFVRGAALGSQKFGIWFSRPTGPTLKMRGDSKALVGWVRVNYRCGNGHRPKINNHPTPLVGTLAPVSKLKHQRRRMQRSGGSCARLPQHSDHARKL